MRSEARVNVRDQKTAKDVMVLQSPTSTPITAGHGTAEPSANQRANRPKPTSSHQPRRGAQQPRRDAAGSPDAPSRPRLSLHLHLDSRDPPTLAAIQSTLHQFVQRKHQRPSSKPRQKQLRSLISTGHHQESRRPRLTQPLNLIFLIQSPRECWKEA